MPTRTTPAQPDKAERPALYRAAADVVMFRALIHTRNVFWAKGQLFCIFRNFWYELHEDAGLFRMTGHFFSKSEFQSNYLS